MNRKRSDTIAFKLAIAFIITAVLQSLLISYLLISGGVIERSKSNEYKIFSEKVNGRADNLENEMTNVWTNFELYTNQIRQYFTEMSSLNGENVKSADEILEDMAPVVMDALYYTKTTGAFLILENEDGGENTHPAVYIRNVNPDRADEKNSNLYLLSGPWSVAEKMKVVTDSNWSPRLALTENNRDFYEKPFQHVGIAPVDRWLGYWSPPFKVKPDGEDVITYSIPLTDKKGNPIGVFGVEIAVNYLYKFLPPSDLQPMDSYGYFIGSISDDGTEAGVVASYGAMQNRLFHVGGTLRLEEVDGQNSVYALNGHNSANKIYACVSPMKMYYNNTPYDGEEWCLVGLMEKKVLMQQPERIQKVLLMAFFLSLCIGTVVAVAAGKWFTKLARVIELSEVQVGAFEIKMRSSKVFMTNQIPKLLNLSKEQQREFAKDKHKFWDFLHEISQSRQDEPNLYRIMIEGEEHWLRITQKEEDGIIRGVVMDVTDEVLQTRALKEERDYDGLTGVKNRRAFEHVQEICNAKLNKDSNVGAIMCDLNELKQVNDRFGHDKGDEYIRFAAEAICKAFPSGGVFRVGGDEFVVLIDSVSEEEVKNACGKLLKRMEEYREKTGFKAGVAVGYSFYDPAEDHKLEDTLLRADAAMYRQKNEMKYR
ncbi:diguanylate cyclase [Clostridium sp. MCC353]|uniref:sensor domain-containing diguanylate cyclase n=1 Tax=Clostridium sp. MCC353 TaxID=2592646 RepID=UPI001C019854|nr:diguanylate cyclase [Clostridium sp. MCC353]MBT9779458.1 diguanylate cyclase [Clostridium sp. MCC353]